MAVRLDIGSGGKPFYGEGWLGVDPYHPEADVQCSGDKLPYGDNTVDEIYSSHMLEHITKLDVPKFLKEWFRVLKSGGKLILRVPDLEWCCRYWLDHPGIGWEMDIIYGGQSRNGEFHKTGFNYEIALNYLKEAGFIVKKFEEMETHSQKTLSFECQKPKK